MYTYVLRAHGGYHGDKGRGPHETWPGSPSGAIYCASRVFRATLGLKAFTLADLEARELLLPAQDPADSGIDSDATDSERRDRRQARLNEESVDEESDVTIEIDMPVPYCAQHHDRSFAERPVRVSPSLFEVELTASDEDDISVLELIIPYQQPRYQKLATSSPLKTKIKVPRYLCSFLCCFRK